MNERSLSDVQMQMLHAGEFHVDGWNSQRGRDAVADLERRGLVTSFESASDQYTAINYRRSELGDTFLKGVAS